MAKVSIIVPIYNKASYLDHSIKSLLGQTLQDIEVILVNDGSTDQSLAICQKFKQMDQRIILIDQANGGVCRARNTGLAVSTGQYIGFVDPDDWIEADMYRSLYDHCRLNDAPVGLCNFYFEKAGISTPVILNTTSGILGSDEIFNQLLLNMLAPDPEQPYKKEVKGSVLRLLVKKELIDDHSMMFEPALTYMEDLLFNIQLLSVTDRLVIDPGVWYHYMVQPESSSKSYINGLFDELLNVMDFLEKTLKKAKVYEKAFARLNYRLVNTAIRSIINEAHVNNPKSLKEKLAEIKRITSYPPVQAVIPELDLSHLTKSRKWVFKAVQNRWSLALYLYFKLNKKFLDPAAGDAKA